MNVRTAYHEDWAGAEVADRCRDDGDSATERRLHPVGDTAHSVGENIIKQ